MNACTNNYKFYRGVKIIVKKEIKLKYQHLYSDTTDRPGFLVRRLHQIHVAMFLEECSGSDITPVQFAVLSSLMDNHNTDQITLGASVGIDRTNIADVVARLEARGLIKRAVNPDDRRMKLVSITAKGSGFVEKHMEGMMIAQERFLEPLSLGEKNILMTLLKKVFSKNNKAGRAQMNTNIKTKKK